MRGNESRGDLAGENFVHEAAALREHALDRALLAIREDDAVGTDPEAMVPLERRFELTEVAFP